MNQITKRDLDGQIRRLNLITKSPETPYTETNGKFVANIGNYHLDSAYGGHKLVRMMNEGGGITDVLGMGYGSKRQTYERLVAYIRGVEQESI